MNDKLQGLLSKAERAKALADKIAVYAAAKESAAKEGSSLHVKATTWNTGSNILQSEEYLRVAIARGINEILSDLERELKELLEGKPTFGMTDQELIA